MEHWKKHQRHDETIRSVLKRTSCLDKSGRIRRWQKHVWTILVSLGHTSLDYHKCSCYKETILE